MTELDLDTTDLSVEIAEVFGLPAADSGDWSAETLVHNPKNAVTSGVFRIRSGTNTAILKVLSGDKQPASDAWRSSEEPSHWNYWRREALVYRSSLLPTLANAGLGAPKLLASFDRSESEIALWLEDVEGRRGDVWEMSDHEAAALALGRAHATAAASLSHLHFPGLSRQYLRHYSDKLVDTSLLENDAVWQLPLVAQCLGAPVREAGRKLLAERAWLLDLMETLPRTLCHLDFWPMNLIRRADGGVVALDWSFVGDGAIGEDLGNHVPDSAFDLFVDPRDLSELDRVTFAAFVAGLREAGWRGAEREARLGVCASAVKYGWLLPLMLERAVAGEHSSYGGVGLADPSEQYRRRGETLRFLAAWVDEARALAGSGAAFGSR